MEWFFIIPVIIVFIFLMGQKRASDREIRRDEKLTALNAKMSIARQHIANFENELEATWPACDGSLDWRQRDYIMMSRDQIHLRFAGVEFFPELQIKRDQTVAVGDIVTVELQQSSETIMRYETTTTTKKGSPLLRAAVGGLAFGGAGAVVGAVSAKESSAGTTTGTSQTRKGPIYLVIGTTDIHHPMVKHKMPNMEVAESWLHRIRGAIALLSRG